MKLLGSNAPEFCSISRSASSSIIHFPRRGHAALVEARQTAGRRGIVHGGSIYGCVFTEGADNNLFSFASLAPPSGRRLFAAFSPFVLVVWVCLKNLLRWLSVGTDPCTPQPTTSLDGWS